MATDPLFERLQRALWPDYRLERELDSGGQGIVFVAHEITLDRPVAVKIIRPELATAHAADAFLREARIIASLHNPNVVSIYRTGEAAGLHYYIMELMGGPTLAQRLEDSGRLPLDDAIRLGKDLLAGLEAVHHAGVVHRDVKPSNIFLLPGRAVLADFGIARPPTGPERVAEGTPEYMAPEQIAGGPITPRTDLYSTAAVLYEAITGRRYPSLGETPSWSGMPWRVARVLRHALREAPDQRWADARTFRRALWRAYLARYVQRTVALTVAGVALGAGAASFALRPATCRGALTVALPPFAYEGPAEHRVIADSLAGLVRQDLGAHPDFCVTEGRGALRVSGRLSVSEAGVRVQLSSIHLPASESRAPVSAWPALRDSLTYRVLLAVWDAKSPLAPSLPVRGLPRTPQGLARFIEAEQLVAGAQWENAYRAYALAEATDSTCWLCSWRVNEVSRWLGRQRDPARARRYLSHIDSFPDWYASLMRAGELEPRERLDTLRAVTERWGDFFLGWFQWGDELFHRGSLAGHARAEAIAPLETAARRRPDFAPAWEHLAWVYIAEGDSAGATRTLDSLDRHLMSGDPYAVTLRALLQLAFAWRFLPRDHALAVTRGALNDPVAGRSTDLAAGPRMLAAFDAPHGVVAFGEILASGPARDLQRSGLIAQVLGLTALGKPLEARAVARRLLQVSPEIELALFAAELEAAIALLDDPAAVPESDAPTLLHSWSASRTLPERLRRRATWMSNLLARRPTGDSLDGDPFSRTIQHLTRARAAAQRGDLGDATRALRWHEHTSVIGLPTGLPQAAEIDWAFGPLAYWRLARWSDGRGDRRDACDAYQTVVRHWDGGEPLYRARADTAALRLRQLGCA